MNLMSISKLTIYLLIYANAFIMHIIKWKCILLNAYIECICIFTAYAGYAKSQP